MLNPIKYILIIYCACNQEFLHCFVTFTSTADWDQILSE